MGLIRTAKYKFSRVPFVTAKTNSDEPYYIFYVTALILELGRNTIDMNWNIWLPI